MRVYKQKLRICDTQKVIMQKGAKVLHVGMQKGHVCAWFECDENAPMEERTIHCVGTGFDLPNASLHYLGTVLIYNDSLVYHFYEEIQE